MNRLISKFPQIAINIHYWYCRQLIRLNLKCNNNKKTRLSSDNRIHWRKKSANPPLISAISIFKSRRNAHVQAHQTLEINHHKDVGPIQTVHVRYRRCERDYFLLDVNSTNTFISVAAVLSHQFKFCADSP